MDFVRNLKPNIIVNAAGSAPILPPINGLMETKEGNEELKFDYGFVCLGMKAVQSVLQDIKDAFKNENDIEIINIGDSMRARRIIEGSEDGHNILNTLEKRGCM